MLPENKKKTKILMEPKPPPNTEEFKYRIRLECSNYQKKKCRAKDNMLTNVTDKYSVEFFQQECRLQKWENYEKHCKDCPLADPWLDLAKLYCDNFNLRNRENMNTARSTKTSYTPA